MAPGNDSSRERVLGLLGLAYRSRRAVAGATAAAMQLRKGRGVLVLLAADASPETARRVRSWTGRRRVKVVAWGAKEELGAALGRPVCTVVCFTDPGLARRLEELLRGV
ncbi:MAG: L7Ae/L30e/S12e/Gadd45 family ribosomal protein [Acidobacteriota bacterium]